MNTNHQTVGVAPATLALIDRGRDALADDTGHLSRAAFLAAAVEHYTADLAADGYAIADTVNDERFTDLAGKSIPFRPAAQWAIIDSRRTPTRVQLAAGRGPGGHTVLTVVAEILPHLTTGTKYGGWRAMLALAGYQVDDTREWDSMSDGRDMIPITTS